MFSGDARMSSLLSACNLAKAGMNENLLKIYYPIDKGLYKQYYALPVNGQGRQRASEAWTRGKESYLVVRAHRIFISLFANNTDYSRVLSVTDMWIFYLTYHTLYPKDAMTPNRLHYMVCMVRARKLRIKECCSSCSKPYLIHESEFHWLPCSICEITKSIITENKLKEASALEDEIKGAN